jgi:hypothetical protein
MPMDKTYEQRVDDDLYPLTAREALKKWDDGRSLFTVEMGGLGPGYEQCIHVAAMETIRLLLDAGLEGTFSLTREKDQALWKEDCDAIDRALRVVNEEHDLGLSGAQAGAVKTLAYRALRDGWREMVWSAKRQDPDRLIQVSKHWPGKP